MAQRNPQTTRKTKRNAKRKHNKTTKTNWKTNMRGNRGTGIRNRRHLMLIGPRIGWGADTTDIGKAGGKRRSGGFLGTPLTLEFQCGRGSRRRRQRRWSAGGNIGHIFHVHCGVATIFRNALRLFSGLNRVGTFSIRMHFHFCTPAHTHTHTGCPHARTQRRRRRTHRNRSSSRISKKGKQNFFTTSVGGWRTLFVRISMRPAGRWFKCNTKSIISPFHTKLLKKP